MIDNAALFQLTYSIVLCVIIHLQIKNGTTFKIHLKTIWKKVSTKIKGKYLEAIIKKSFYYSWVVFIRATKGALEKYISLSRICESLHLQREQQYAGFNGSGCLSLHTQDFNDSSYKYIIIVTFFVITCNTVIEHLSPLMCFDLYNSILHS